MTRSTIESRGAAHRYLSRIQSDSTVRFIRSQTLYALVLGAIIGAALIYPVAFNAGRHVATGIVASCSTAHSFIDERCP